MPMFSLFVLALWVLLRSLNDLGKFAIDPHFIAWVGIIFVVAVIFETVWLGRGHYSTWLRRP